MAYTVLTGSILELTWEGRHDDQQVITQVHYRYTGTSLPDGRQTALDFMTEIQGAGGLEEVYLLCISEDVRNIGLYAQWIYPIRYAYVQSPDPLKDGQIIGPAMPANVSQAAIRRGALADHHSRSVLKLPGVPVSSVVNSMLTNAHKDALQEFIDESCTLKLIGVGGQMTPVAYNRASPGASATMEEGFPGEAVRVLRRRTVGLGA